jgi:hypothetical protein
MCITRPFPGGPGSEKGGLRFQRSTVKQEKVGGGIEPRKIIVFSEDIVDRSLDFTIDYTETVDFLLSSPPNQESIKSFLIQTAVSYSSVPVQVLAQADPRILSSAYIR